MLYLVQGQVFREYWQAGGYSEKYAQMEVGLETTHWQMVLGCWWYLDEERTDLGERNESWDAECLLGPLIDFPMWWMVIMIGNSLFELAWKVRLPGISGNHRETILLTRMMAFPLMKLPNSRTSRPALVLMSSAFEETEAEMDQTFGGDILEKNEC